MAGYFQVSDHLYDGAHKAGEALQNGVFVEITAAGVKKIAAAGDATFRVDEKTSLWGLPALRLSCIGEGTKDIYFVENEIENYGDRGDFDDSQFEVKKDHFVKMRRPALNDKLIMSVDENLFAAINEGDIVSPAAGGYVA